MNSRSNEIKEMLKEIIDYISKNKDANITDVSFQMKKINATINELKKNNIPVPDELINLKLSLSSQIDKVNDSEKLRKELIGYLEIYTSELKGLVSEKTVKKEKVKKIIIQERVTLSDFIIASVLPIGVEFYAYYKNKRISATLLKDGSLEMLVKNKKKTFENPRSAAIAITGYQIDLWKFWRLDFEGKPLTLDDYRKTYLKKKQKGDYVISSDDAEVITNI